MLEQAVLAFALPYPGYVPRRIFPLGRRPQATVARAQETALKARCQPTFSRYLIPRYTGPASGTYAAASSSTIPTVLTTAGLTSVRTTDQMIGKQNMGARPK